MAENIPEDMDQLSSYMKSARWVYPICNFFGIILQNKHFIPDFCKKDPKYENRLFFQYYRAMLIDQLDILCVECGWSYNYMCELLLIKEIDSETEQVILPDHLPSYFYLLAVINFEMFGYLVVDFCLDFKNDVNEGLRRALEERVNMFRIRDVNVRKMIDFTQPPWQNIEQEREAAAANLLQGKSKMAQPFREIMHCVTSSDLYEEKFITEEKMEEIEHINKVQIAQAKELEERAQRSKLNTMPQVKLVDPPSDKPIPFKDIFQVEDLRVSTLKIYDQRRVYLLGKYRAGLQLLLTQLKEKFDDELASYTKAYDMHRVLLEKYSYKAVTKTMFEKVEEDFLAIDDIPKLDKMLYAVGTYLKHCHPASTTLKQIKISNKGKK